jgi:retron-type reverse transcriptase
MMKTSKSKVLKFTFPDITDWNAINWHKTGKYVDRFLKLGYVNNNIFHSNKKRTPQKGLFSPLLANITLDGMKKLLRITCKEIISNEYVDYVTKGNYRMVRCADDFVTFAKSKKDIKHYTIS